MVYESKSGYNFDICEVCQEELNEAEKTFCDNKTEEQKYQENKKLLDKCYADIETASYQRKIQNCTTKPTDSSYFYCDADFLRSNIEIEQIEQKNCETKYPPNF